MEGDRMIRKAGLLRKLPGVDDLYLTIDGTMAWMRGDDIPLMLSGRTDKPLYTNRKNVGTIRTHTRPGHEDLIVVTLLDPEYTIWRERFQKVWSGQLKWAHIEERIPELWTRYFPTEAGHV